MPDLDDGKNSPRPPRVDAAVPPASQTPAASNRGGAVQGGSALPAGDPGRNRPPAPAGGQDGPVRIVAAGPEHRTAYDQAVAGCGKPHFMQLWGWGEVKATTGWRPFRYLAVDDTGQPRGAVTVLARDVPGIGTILYAPTGPAVDYRDRPAAQALVQAMVDLAARCRAVMLRVDPDVPAPCREVIRWLRQQGFRPGAAATAFEALQPRFVMRLSLADTPDETLSRFEAKTRYNIRYAGRRGVRTRQATGEKDLRAFYDLLRLTAARQGFAIRSLAYYQALWHHLIVPGYGRIFLAEHEGRPAAGVMVFRCGDTVWYLYGGTDYQARHVMPSHAAQWAAIQWAIAEGCRVYDFRGVSGNVDPSDRHYGLYRFKKGFGAQLVEYIGEWDQVYRPLRHATFRVAFAVRRHLLRLRRRLAGTGESEA